MAKMNEPSLEDRIRSLPQELKDIVFGFTVAVKPGQTVIIDSKHKAPMQLQIDSATRKQNAPIYFGTSIFRTKLPWTRDGTVPRWLRAQSSIHRDMITTIRFSFKHSKRFWDAKAAGGQWGRNRFYTMAFRFAEHDLRAVLGQDRLDVLEVKVRAEQTDGKVKIVWAKKDDVREVLGL